MKCQYECDECEDIEVLDEIINDGWACECGGSMYRIKNDHYMEVEYIEKCMTCRNTGSNLCGDCKHN